MYRRVEPGLICVAALFRATLKKDEPEKFSRMDAAGYLVFALLKDLSVSPALLALLRFGGMYMLHAYPCDEKVGVWF